MGRNVHKEEIKLVRLPQDAIAEDRGLRNCSQPQLVLASKTDAAYYKNDRTAIAYIFDTMEVTLEKGGVSIPAPGVAVTFPHQPDAAGFVIDWRQVEEWGCYRVRIDYEISGVTGFFYYGSFNFLEYTPFNARGTVRLFVVLNDLVRRQGINYRGSGFAGTVRFRGIFGFMQPNYEGENIIYSDRTRHKVRIEALRTYELHTGQLLYCMTRLIDEEALLAANQIFVSDHNATNHNQHFYDFPVILSADETPRYKYNEGIYASLTAVFLEKVAAYESKYDGDIKGSANVVLSLPTVVTTPGAGTVVNSNDTYILNVAMNATETLPDTEINVYVNGVLNQTATLPTLDPSNEINITP